MPQFSLVNVKSTYEGDDSNHADTSSPQNRQRCKPCCLTDGAKFYCKGAYINRVRVKALAYTMLSCWGAWDINCLYHTKSECHKVLLTKKRSIAIYTHPIQQSSPPMSTTCNAHVLSKKSFLLTALHQNISISILGNSVPLFHDLRWLQKFWYLCISRHHSRCHRWKRRCTCALSAFSCIPWLLRWPAALQWRLSSANIVRPNSSIWGYKLLSWVISPLTCDLKTTITWNNSQKHAKQCRLQHLGGLQEYPSQPGQAQLWTNAQITLVIPAQSSQ